LFCIVVGRAQAPVREVRRYQDGLHIQLKDPMPFVNLYFFHLLDPEWGHVTIRFCPHPPVHAQGILNGHEFVERATTAQAIRFHKEENCFTEVADADALGRVADTLRAAGSEGRLVSGCERWLYSTCLVFALPLAEQEKTRFRYAYSLYQAEDSRNYLFGDGRHREPWFEALIDRTRASLDLPTVKTLFGRRRRPYYRNEQGRLPRGERAVEKPGYDLTVFQRHFGPWTLKVYTKGERVLRVEVILHNARRLPCGYGLDKWPLVLGQMPAVLEQYSTRQASYDLQKLRAKAVVERPAKSLRYRVCAEGLRGLSALLVLRNRVLVPLLSRLGRRRRCPHCHLSELDRRYDNIQKEMQHVFEELHIAAGALATRNCLVWRRKRPMYFSYKFLSCFGLPTSAQTGRLLRYSRHRCGHIRSHAGCQRTAEDPTYARIPGCCRRW
jgi:hypothetical protein